MQQAKILIRYQDSLIVEKINNRLDFINIPPYSNSESITNISVFISLLLNSFLDSNFNSTISLDFFSWQEKFDIFLPEYLFKLDDNTYLYDLNLFLSSSPEFTSTIISSFPKMPNNLTLRSIKSLYDMSNPIEESSNDESFSEEIPYTYCFSLNREYLTTSLSSAVRFLYSKRTEKDVLLLYSGGKDSTLAAIRLHNAGYNVHFLHFDNGRMKDTDKPYLTYRKIFTPEDGYYFSYLHQNEDISYLFNSYFSSYNDKGSDTITSEIRCLSCRMAMYTRALEIATLNNFSYIAEGARISQKFMLEQKPIINRLESLAAKYGIKLLFPVLELTSDEEEIQELLRNGYSSKTWESKCLIGRPTRDKTKEEEQSIISYYDTNLEPKMLRLINKK